MLDRLSHSCFALFPAPAVLLASISPSTPNMDAHGTPGGLSGTVPRSSVIIHDKDKGKCLYEGHNERKTGSL